jgi:hypothetical protein
MIDATAKAPSRADWSSVRLVTVVFSVMFSPTNGSGLETFHPAGRKSVRARVDVALSTARAVPVNGMDDRMCLPLAVLYCRSYRSAAADASALNSKASCRSKLSFEHDSHAVQRSIGYLAILKRIVIQNAEPCKKRSHKKRSCKKDPASNHAKREPHDCGPLSNTRF